jgi:hypothetical protein
LWDNVLLFEWSAVVRVCLVIEKVLRDCHTVNNLAAAWQLDRVKHYFTKERV